MGSVTISFVVDDVEDRDLLRWLGGHRGRKRSEAIRVALRRGLARGGVTLGDVYREVCELKRRVEAGVIVAGPGAGPADGDVDEPPEAAAALAKLGEM